MFEEVFREETSGASRPNYATGGVLVGSVGGCRLLIAVLASC